MAPWRSFLFLSILILLAGCGRGNTSTPEIVLYSSVDEPYLTPLLKRFEQQTLIHVRLVTDTEANKSAGLGERLEAEKDHPHADVYWGNELFHTIRLAEAGCFEPYQPPAAQSVPARWRGTHDLYTPIGLRARMIVISTRPEFRDLVSSIHGLSDLTNPKLKGKIAIAHPGFGTTSGHFACLNLLWGDAKFGDFVKGLRANDVQLLGGNSAVVDQVAAGNFAAGLSDNDDIHNAKADGQKIDAIIPDQDAAGTLLIPTTIALVKGAPHAPEAKKLIDFLCDSSVEKELITNGFLAASVRDPGDIKPLDVDCVQASHQMRRTIESALNVLQDRKE